MTYSYDRDNKTYTVNGYVFRCYTEAKEYIDSAYKLAA